MISILKWNDCLSYLCIISVGELVAAMMIGRGVYITEGISVLKVWLNMNCCSFLNKVEVQISYFSG